jgi:hypothetical protein
MIGGLLRNPLWYLFSTDVGCLFSEMEVQEAETHS